MTGSVLSPAESGFPAFWKMQGGGNDFVVIDNLALGFPGGDPAGLIRNICRRALGVGADGLILLEKASTADFFCRFFNPDGSEAEMCGNGGRCAARFAWEQGLAGPEMVFQTRAGLVRAVIDLKRRVKLEMPVSAAPRCGLLVDGRDWCEKVDFVNTGVPHVVVMVDQDLEAVDLVGRGSRIRYHKDFAPAGTNVNFVRVINKHCLAIRTYERGVEAETLACGTGSVAAALLCGQRGMVTSPVEIIVKSGEKLLVWFTDSADGRAEVFLEGAARIVYKGVLEEVIEAS